MNTKPATDGDSCTSALPPTGAGGGSLEHLLEVAITYECNLNLLLSKIFFKVNCYFCRLCSTLGVGIAKQKTGCWVL